MMVSSNSTVAFSPFVELRNEFDWYEHSLLPQTNNIRQELSGVGSRKINTHFTFYQTIEQKFERSSTTRSGSVEIKVEVDPNLYENCETPVDDMWLGFHLKNTQCNKPTVMLLSKSHSLVNNEQNIYVHNSDSKDFDITNNRYRVGNGQSQVAGTELDDKQNNMGCEESRIEARELIEDGSEICTETPFIEESGDSYD